MPNTFNKEQRIARVAIVRKRIADGLYPVQIAKELGVSRSAVCQLMSYHGIKSKHGRGRPTTTAARLAARKAEYNVTTSEPWQKADPAQFPDDIITEAQRMLRCDRQHAAWVLSCPKDFNPQHRARIGNRGGSAIG